MGFKNLPKSANTLQKIVLEYKKNVRISIISELSQKKMSGEVVGDLLMNGHLHEIF